MFFEPLIEQIVTLEFENISTFSCNVYKYNIKSKTLEKFDTQINYNYDNNSCTVSIRNSSTDFIYFFMYEYN